MSSFELPVIAIPNMVFFPRTTIHIYLNNEKHIAMLEKMCKDNKELIISLAVAVGPSEIYDTSSSNDKFSVKSKMVYYAPMKIGTSGYPKIVRSFENGSIEVAVKGRRRVIVEGIVQNLPHPVFSVKEYPDRTESKIFSEGIIERLENIFEKWEESYIDDSIKREEILGEITSVAHLADFISHFIIDDIELKQILLENDSVFERIQILSSLLKDDHPFKPDLEIARMVKDFDPKV